VRLRLDDATLDEIEQLLARLALDATKALGYANRLVNEAGVQTGLPAGVRAVDGIDQV
jgi:antitoxin component of RelBE/YafQ-DinJ toxin-antitoxin module